MSNQHLSATDFDIMIGDTLVKVESMSATISDNRKAVMTNGVPDGHVNGDVSCSGDIELDSKHFNALIETAKSKGSWRDVPTFDIIYTAKTASNKQKIELFGCLLNISDLLSNDGKGGEKAKHKLNFMVTSPDFVRINGVPYLAKSDTKGI